MNQCCCCDQLVRILQLVQQLVLELGLILRCLVLCFKFINTVLNGFNIIVVFNLCFIRSFFNGCWNCVFFNNWMFLEKFDSKFNPSNYWISFSCLVSCLMQRKASSIELESNGSLNSGCSDCLSLQLLPYAFHLQKVLIMLMKLDFL